MGKDHELLEAARNGNLAVIEKILYQKNKRSGPLASLRRGPGANVQDSSGYSALHHAALNGHTDCVRMLLAHDASCNLPDVRGSSPLHLAAWAGHQDIVKILLTLPQRPANPNLQTIDDETPLHCAAQHGHTGALTTLLAHGANPNISNSRGETPLDLAAQYGRFQVVQMLVRAHPDLLNNFKEDNHHNYASMHPYSHSHNLLNHSPLHLASRNGHKNIVEILLTAGVNVNLLTKNGTALHEAALCGKDGVVRTLLKHGADLKVCDDRGRTALDVLNEFPPHVTRSIVTVIENYRNSCSWDDSCESADDAERSYFSTGGNGKINGDVDVNNSMWSPTSSLKARQRAVTMAVEPTAVGGYVAMAPINSSKISPTPPKKPPRRNLSVSPTHHQYHSPTSTVALMSTSFDSSSSYGGANINNNNNKPSAYEYLYLSKSGQYKPSSNHSESSDYVQMSTPLSKTFKHRNDHTEEETEDDENLMPIPSTRNLPHYENHQIIRIINPNRKLRRQKDGNYQNDTFITVRKEINRVITTPLSPTHYHQPPTPEHPPPSAVQAEKCIHERIRPLSQEYKRRSGRDHNLSGFNNAITSPMEPPCTSLGASSGSLSSSISLSDRSGGSTDCVEEYIGDVPFAGLFKGSTMALDRTCVGGVDDSRKDSKINRSNSRVGGENNNLTSSDEEELTMHNSSKAQTNAHPHTQILSPFDEQEEWAKISKIMSSFGSGLVRESVFVSDIEKRFEKQLLGENAQQQSIFSTVSEWLSAIGLQEFEKNFLENGYDDVRFINGIISAFDLTLMSIPENHHQYILDSSARQLPRAPIIKNISDNNTAVNETSEPTSTNIISQLNNNNNQGVFTSISVDDWLNTINLIIYSEIFRKHLYTDMERVLRIWEIELQAVLEIAKLGHRRRILYSVSGQRQLEPPKLEEINNDLPSNRVMSMNGSITEGNIDIPRILPEEDTKKTLRRHKKNRPAPKPPIRTSNLEIRGPSELLLGVPSGLRTQWRHTAATLVTGNIQYQVFYLGSTVVKELRGTESTRKSIQKLKRGEQRLAIASTGTSIGGTTLSSSPSGITTITIKESHQMNPLNPRNHKNILQINKKLPINLSISYRGVKFIDCNCIISSTPQQNDSTDTDDSHPNNGVGTTICEHEIRNIDCACQDADDLTHFAYITKDGDQHFCHVFMVDSMDLATEIILTLGQAFEVAYQLALRESISNTDPGIKSTPQRSPSTTKIPVFN